MPLSAGSLRNLNKIALMAIGIKPPTLTGRFVVEQGDNFWKIEMYSSSELDLGGAVTVSDVLGGAVNKVLSNKVVNLGFTIANVGWGVAPQLDFPTKFTFQGSKPLEFTVNAELVLQSSVEQDYLRPLEALCYLALPTRGRVLSLSGLITKIIDWGQGLFVGAKEEDKQKWSTAFKNNVGAVYNGIQSIYYRSTDQEVRGAAASGRSGAEGYGALTQAFNSSVGAAYFMNVPPPFRVTTAGSGLDLRYGTVLISDVYIKSIQLRMPTLFYEGGYPAHIPITLGFGTYRPLTADSLYNMVNSTVQQWTAPK